MKKYKLKKITDKLQGNFQIGNIYKAQPYAPDIKFSVLIDDNGQRHLINTNKPNFDEHFLNVNKERKDKLIQIEKS